MNTSSASTAFDLTEAQLLPIGEVIHGVPIRRCRLKEIVPLDRSACGDKVLARLVVTSLDRKEISTPLFLKKFSWKGRYEAAHYRHLARCEVPTPRFYCAILHADGDEILFLERLDRIGFDRHSEAEWRQFLTVLARLNACKVTTDYLPHLHPFEQGGRIDGSWITGFNSFPPSAQQIETALRDCGIADSELPNLSQAAHRLCERVAALPQGLVHQDFMGDNLGWRGAPGNGEEMVVFDVHKNALGPRFADVAPYLGLPDWSHTAAYLDLDHHGQQRSLRESLIRHYLQQYADSGGGSVSLEAFYEEAALLFWAHKAAILWWLAEQHHTERIVQVLNFLRAYI